MNKVLRGVNSFFINENRVDDFHFPLNKTVIKK